MSELYMKAPSIPLAERVRPITLDDIAGQEHILGRGGKLRLMIESGTLPSIIFWGPPGSGKTTIANILAKHFDLPFYTLSAVSSGVKDVRNVIQTAKDQGQVLLFIDEIHRFSKSQQDSLLAAVEDGTIKLIGATTENPSFEVIRPLLSRCQIYILEPLGKVDLIKILEHAIVDDDFLRSKSILLQETDLLIMLSGGDARKLLNIFELIINMAGSEQVVINNDIVKKYSGHNYAAYDKSGEQHYDIISAFIKSIRGSDPNAALYWLARMIEGGEDPNFIARRLLILSSEDIGMANPTAFVIANNCFQAVGVIGYPECDLILAQTVIYLATSPKSNSTYVAIKNAKQHVRITGDLSVPLHLRNAPTTLMKDLNYGSSYLYPHDFSASFIEQQYIPAELKNPNYYKPLKNEREFRIKDSLRKMWKSKYEF